MPQLADRNTQSLFNGGQGSEFDKTPGGDPQNAPLTPEQTKALAAIYNGQQNPKASNSGLMSAQIQALSKVLAKATEMDAQKHVQEVGLEQAHKDLADLQAASEGQVDLGKIDVTKPKGALQSTPPGEQGPQTAPVDPRATQSPEVMANNEQIRKDAFNILHPTSKFGKILAGIPGFGAAFQGQQLDNMRKALEIGGGDPQGEYYTSYKGTLQQAMTGDKPLDAKEMSDLSLQQLRATTDALQTAATSQAAIYTAQGAKLRSILESRSLWSKTVQGAEGFSKSSLGDEVLSDMKQTMGSLENTIKSIKNIGSLKITPRGAVPSGAKLLPDSGESAGTSTQGSVGSFSFKKPSAQK